MKPDLKGRHCPTCGQLVKLYKRRINKNAAIRIINLYKISKKTQDVEFFDVKTFAPNYYERSNDWQTPLRENELIVELFNDDNSKKTSGRWKITNKGKLFVEKKISVPTYVWIFDSKVYGHSGEQKFIDDCLGQFFNYYELMNEK